MAKKINAEDKINDTTLHELLLMVDAKLKHIEDITADNRAIIVKLVKQSNQIVEFLKTLEIEISDVGNFEYGIEEPNALNNTISNRKMDELQSIFEDFQARKKELKEFEKELKKYKKDITPGQIGEA
tara:strand:+ start:301 stop:681 length:381 start_codon:yes stop_codon:yes gene_type:complete